MKLKSLADKEDWEELEKFAKSKKSPIGYLVRLNLFSLNCITLVGMNVSLTLWSRKPLSNKNMRTIHEGIHPEVLEGLVFVICLRVFFY